MFFKHTHTNTHTHSVKKTLDNTCFQNIACSNNYITEGNNVPLPPSRDSDKLHHTSKGNFLGKNELMKRFYPVTKERIWSCVSDNDSCQYLSHRVENGLTLKFSADEIPMSCKKCSVLFCSLRNMKFFPKVLDCMPNICRQQPVSAAIPIVLVNEKEAEVKENIL